LGQRAVCLLSKATGSVYQSGPAGGGRGGFPGLKIETWGTRHPAWKALEACRRGAAGFADHLIAEIAFTSGADEVITFDKAFGRVSGVRRIK